MISKLPVFTTVFGAYASVFRNTRALVRAAFLPGLALVLLGFIDSNASTGKLISFLIWLASLPFLAMIAVAIHRVVLLGPDSLDNPWSLRWSPRESRFFQWLLILGVFFSLVTGAFAVIFLMAPTEWLGFVLTVIASVYVQGRFIMVLPATALSKSMILSNSWYLTAGNGPRVAITLLIPIVIFVLAFWAAMILVSIGSFTASLVLMSIAVILFFAVEIAVVSLCYQFLTSSSFSTDEG